MRGKGSNPKSRYNLKSGGNMKRYWVCECDKGHVEGPYTFDKAWCVSQMKNGSEKTNKYFVGT
jgi:hypothetical protein